MAPSFFLTFERSPFPQAADATLHEPAGERNQQAPEGVGLTSFANSTVGASEYDVLYGVTLAREACR